jgi:hypothetical protein
MARQKNVIHRAPWGVDPGQLADGVVFAPTRWQQRLEMSANRLI